MTVVCSDLNGALILLHPGLRGHWKRRHRKNLRARIRSECVGKLFSKQDTITHRNYDYLNKISVRLEMSIFCHGWGCFTRIHSSLRSIVNFIAGVVVNFCQWCSH